MVACLCLVSMAMLLRELMLLFTPLLLLWGDPALEEQVGEEEEEKEEEEEQEVPAAFTTLLWAYSRTSCNRSSAHSRAEPGAGRSDRKSKSQRRVAVATLVRSRRWKSCSSCWWSTGPQRFLRTPQRPLASS